VAYTPLADIFELPFMMADFKTAYRAEDGVLGNAIGEDAELFTGTVTHVLPKELGAIKNSKGLKEGAHYCRKSKTPFL
jgi:hypothetical protein